MLNSMYKNR